MGPNKISQNAFDAAVRENVEEFDMDEDEAFADAIHTFKLQGVDLSGIITDRTSSGQEHPVIEAIRVLDTAGAADQVTDALDKLRLTCTQENVAIAVRNGAVEKTLSACKQFVDAKDGSSLCTALKALMPLLIDEQSRNEFATHGGPGMIVDALMMDDHIVLELAGSVLGAAASGHEPLKDSFMHLKVEEILVDLIRRCREKLGVLYGACDALRALVAADDYSAPASNAYKNARTIAKAGGVDSILEAASAADIDPTLSASLCATLKALAVNEEVCNSIAASNGIKLVLEFMEASVKSGNKSLARNSCSFLSQLAGSDANKDAIVSQGGCQALIKLASAFSSEPMVLQEVMSAFASITLRSPANAAKAVESGAVDLAMEAMETHPQAAGLQRHVCQMLRNLAVRNPEHRPLILEKGLEKLIRAAKTRHPTCRDAASAALRDLGLDNYN